MDADSIRMMFDYSYWAHRRVWRCIEQLTDEQFTRPFEYSIGSVHAQVVHVMSAEEVWYFRLQGESPSAMRRPEELPTRAEIRRKWDVIERDFRRYLNTLNDADLWTMMGYRTTSGKPMRESRAGILMHLVNHGTDHRAQILGLLHQLGAPTLEQDMILYLREQSAHHTEQQRAAGD